MLLNTATHDTDNNNHHHRRKYRIILLSNSPNIKEQQQQQNQHHEQTTCNFHLEDFISGMNIIFGMNVVSLSFQDNNNNDQEDDTVIATTGEAAEKLETTTAPSIAKQKQQQHPFRRESNDTMSLQHWLIIWTIAMDVNLVTIHDDTNHATSSSKRSDNNNDDDHDDDEMNMNDNKNIYKCASSSLAILVKIGIDPSLNRGNS